MAKRYQTLRLKKAGDIQLVTLNRPEQMNALNVEMARNVRAAFEDIQWDESVKVVILSGSGEKSFCAGLDLKERSQMSEEEILISREREIIPLFHDLGAFSKPIIGAINGVALGGGAELALVCDLCIATPHARFGQTEIRWGMIPSAGGCQRLRLITGMAVAKELILTGKVIEPEQALGLGIYNKVVPPEDLMTEALKMGNEMAQHSSVALKQAKKVLDFGAGLTSSLAFDLEASKECFYKGQAMGGHKAFKPETEEEN
jgi:enoyl-CoA hydratase/carnithine racemase